MGRGLGRLGGRGGRAAERLDHQLLEASHAVLPVGRQQAAVGGRLGGAVPLEARHHGVVLGVDAAPQACQRLDRLGRRGRVADVVDHPALVGAAGAERQVEVDADLVGNVEAQHEVREQRQIARADRKRIRPGPAAAGARRHVDGATQAHRVDEGGVVLERLLGGRGMDELHVVGLDEVLHEDLPVGRDLAEVEGRDRPHARQVDAVEAPRQRRGIDIEVGRPAARIDEHPVVPYRAAHALQAVVGGVEAVGRVAMGPAEVGRAAQRAVQAIRSRYDKDRPDRRRRCRAHPPGPGRGAGRRCGTRRWRRRRRAAAGGAGRRPSPRRRAPPARGRSRRIPSGRRTAARSPAPGTPRWCRRRPAAREGPRCAPKRASPSPPNTPSNAAAIARLRHSGARSSGE